MVVVREPVLHPVPIASLRPTQITVGMREVDEKRQRWREHKGKKRAEFLGWLNRADNRARVRGVRPAHPRHGGSGAFYVLLRRRSSASNRSLRATPQR